MRVMTVIRVALTHLRRRTNPPISLGPTPRLGQGERMRQTRTRVFLWLALTCASASAHANESPVELIEREERALAESLGRNDTSVMERIFAPDCVWLLPDGTALGKRQAIEAIRGGSAYDSLRTASVNVRLFGTTAVAHGVDRWRRGQHRGTFVWSSTWLHRDGRWQIVQVQDSEQRE